MTGLADVTVPDDALHPCCPRPGTRQPGHPAQPGLTTAVFIDIRHFSRLAHVLGPHRTVRLLNDYFSRVAGCVEAAGGTVHSLIGDGLLALFAPEPLAGDAPDPAPDPAPDRAVDAALAVIATVRFWNAERRPVGGPAIEVAIGMDTGPALITTVEWKGNRHRTVIGECINVSAQIEAACKVLGLPLLLSARTRAGLLKPRPTCHVDTIITKGSGELLGLYAIPEAFGPAPQSPARQGPVGERSGVAGRRTPS